MVERNLSAVSFCLAVLLMLSGTAASQNMTLEGTLVAIGGTRGDIVLTVQASDGQYRVWPYYPSNVNNQQLLALERAWKASTEQVKVGDGIKLDCPQVKGYDPALEVRVASCERIVRTSTLSHLGSAGGSNPAQSAAATTHPPGTPQPGTKDADTYKQMEGTWYLKGSAGVLKYEFRRPTPPMSGWWYRCSLSTDTSWKELGQGGFDLVGNPPAIYYFYSGPAEGQDVIRGSICKVDIGLKQMTFTCPQSKTFVFVRRGVHFPN